MFCIVQTPFQSLYVLKRLGIEEKSVMMTKVVIIKEQAIVKENRPCHGFRRHLDEYANA